MEMRMIYGLALAFICALQVEGLAKEAVVSEVKIYEGVPALWVNGKPSTGCMFWSGRVDSDKDIEVMCKAGIHLYNTGCSVDGDDPERGSDVLEGELKGLDAKIARIVRIDPDAKVLVRVGTRIPFTAWWILSHPEERVRCYNIASGAYEYADWASPSSPSWNAVMYNAVRKIVRHCEEKWPDRVLGYNPGACSSTEDMYMYGNNIADFSPCHIKAFGHAAPDPMCFFAQSPFDFRRLLDPVSDRDAVAFRRFQSTAMAETVCRLARTVKDELGKMGRNKICGVFYGYMCRHVNDGGLLCDGHQAQDAVYSSPDVDFIAAPLDYSTRQLGGVAYAQCMPGAVAVRGKLYYAEEDSRLHLAHGQGNQTSGNEEESHWTILRNFFDSYSHGGAMWWMDLMSDGWYRNDWFSIPLGECRAFAERHLSRRGSVAEIAVFAHPDAIAYERAAPTMLSAELISGEMPEVCAIGAPYDVYHLSDIALLARKGGLHSYKMAVLLNAHTVSCALRRDIKRHLCCDGRTVVFLGPAGWNSEDRQGEAGVQDLTGIVVRKQSSSDGAQTESFVDGRRIVFGSTLTSDPTLTVCDSRVRTIGWRVHASNCARPTDRDGAVLVEKTFSQWKSVLCTVNFLPSDLLRRFAEDAGVHVYSPHGDQVFAGPDWFAVAAKMPGRHQFISRDGKLVEVDMKRGEVRYFESGVQPKQKEKGSL